MLEDSTFSVVCAASTCKGLDSTEVKVNAVAVIMIAFFII
ncbi:hypothetical protein X560_0882 [Listeria fleischmannii 1991]|uniref:Uncharacterized protein n=1 Tax=Listeria fleischmannii 1991 TaxID=1430899 RepID=A0A0J8GCF4_9LIST|nr:hypothetical protein X560_0882 [Listeria fleischmannii 1991]